MPTLSPVIIEEFGYAQPSNMVVRFNEKEIAELIDDTNLIDGEILEKYLNTGDKSGLSSEQILALAEGVKVLCRACHDADSLVSSHLVSAGILSPLQSENLMIENIACDIARYYLYDIQVPEIVDRRYRDALDILKRISKGDLKLDKSDEIITESKVYLTSETPRFTL